MNHPVSASRASTGVTLVETAIALAVIGLMTLVIFQLQALGTRQTQVYAGNAQTHQAARQSLEWLVNDLLVSQQAAVTGSGGSTVLTLTATLNGNERTVQYYRDAGSNELVRRVLDPGSDAVVREHRVARSVTAFAATYDPDPAMVGYTVTVSERNVEPLTITGKVHLRNAGGSL